jgi:glucokinase
MKPSLALVADIGGTHARFALAQQREARPTLLEGTVRQLQVADFACLEDAARAFLDSVQSFGTLEHGVIAVAGRVEGDEASMTNHRWRVSSRTTARAVAFESLGLINDFTAQALAVSALSEEHLARVGGPAALPAAATRTHAVLGPGTGLGVSGLFIRPEGLLALESEGGHTGFAPGDEEEAFVLAHLASEFGRVSHERLISGAGLSNIRRALGVRAGEASPAALRPQEITAAARAGDALAQRAVDLFCAVFGAFAGDLVLTLGAWDGVYLTGGLVPRLLPELQASSFRRRFEAKGRFADAMSRVPTLAVLHPQAGLLGAAVHAFRSAS